MGIDCRTYFYKPLTDILKSHKKFFRKWSNWDAQLGLKYKFFTMILQISTNLPELKMMDQCKIIIICLIYVWRLHYPVNPLQSRHLQLVKCKTLWKQKPQLFTLTSVLSSTSPRPRLCVSLPMFPVCDACVCVLYVVTWHQHWQSDVSRGSHSALCDMCDVLPHH